MDQLTDEEHINRLNQVFAMLKSTHGSNYFIPLMCGIARTLDKHTDLHEFSEEPDKSEVETVLTEYIFGRYPVEEFNKRWAAANARLQEQIENPLFRSFADRVASRDNPPDPDKADSPRKI